MPAAGTVIHALGPKLQVLWTCLHRAGMLGRPTLSGLADAAQINLQTLKSSRTKSSMTDEVAQKLSKFAGFDPGDHYWHDSTVGIALRSLPDAKYPGRDTVAAFRALMHRRLELGGTNVQLATTSLQHLDTRLARFQLDASGQHFEEGQPTELLMTVLVETSEEGGVRFGFKRIRVELTLPGTQRLSITNRLGHQTPHPLKDATLTALGGDLTPEWHLTADGVLRGDYVTTEASLGSLVHLHVGDSITAKMSAKLGDGDLHIIAGDDDLSTNQQAVIKALFAQSMPVAKDRGGWLTLTLQTLEVRRGDA